MKELFWAFYFALHFAGAFLGIVIAINLSTWLGLSMFAFFIVKFMLMLPEIKRIWTKLNYVAPRLYDVKGFAHMRSYVKRIWVLWNLSPDPMWKSCLLPLDLGSSMEMHWKDLACLAKLEPWSLVTCKTDSSQGSGVKWRMHENAGSGRRAVASSLATLEWF